MTCVDNILKQFKGADGEKLAAAYERLMESEQFGIDAMNKKLEQLTQEAKLENTMLKRAAVINEMATIDQVNTAKRIAQETGNDPAQVLLDGILGAYGSKAGLETMIEGKTAKYTQWTFELKEKGLDHLIDQPASSVKVGIAMDAYIGGPGSKDAMDRLKWDSPKERADIEAAAKIIVEGRRAAMKDGQTVGAEITEEAGYVSPQNWDYGRFRPKRGQTRKERIDELTEIFYQNMRFERMHFKWTKEQADASPELMEATKKWTRQWIANVMDGVFLKAGDTGGGTGKIASPARNMWIKPEAQVQMQLDLGYRSLREALEAQANVSARQNTILKNFGVNYEEVATEAFRRIRREQQQQNADIPFGKDQQWFQSEMRDRFKVVTGENNVVGHELSAVAYGVLRAYAAAKSLGSAALTIASTEWVSPMAKAYRSGMREGNFITAIGQSIGAVQGHLREVTRGFNSLEKSVVANSMGISIDQLHFSRASYSGGIGSDTSANRLVRLSQWGVDNLATWSGMKYLTNASRRNAAFSTSATLAGWMRKMDWSQLSTVNRNMMVTEGFTETKWNVARELVEDFASRPGEGDLRFAIIGVERAKELTDDQLTLLAKDRFNTDTPTKKQKELAQNDFEETLTTTIAGARQDYEMELSTRGEYEAGFLNPRGTFRNEIPRTMFQFQGAVAAIWTNMFGKIYKENRLAGKSAGKAFIASVPGYIYISGLLTVAGIMRNTLIDIARNREPKLPTDWENTSEIVGKGLVSGGFGAWIGDITRAYIDEGRDGILRQTTGPSVGVAIDAIDIAATAGKLLGGFYDDPNEQSARLFHKGVKMIPYNNMWQIRALVEGYFIRGFSDALDSSYYDDLMERRYDDTEQGVLIEAIGGP